MAKRDISRANTEDQEICHRKLASETGRQKVKARGETPEAGAEPSTGLEGRAEVLSDARFSGSLNAGQRAEMVTGLQRSHGNAKVQRLLRSRGVQAKLTVNPPDDQYEREADRAAEGIVKSSSDQVQRQTEIEEEKIQAKAAVGAVPEVSEDLESHINAARGGGQPLPDTVRSSLEPHFGHDFQGVRIHADAQADGLSRRLAAKAFTTGQDVFFAQGAYQPDSQEGRRLIGHELTHVVQQGSTQVSMKAVEAGEKTTAESKEAASTSPKDDATVQLEDVVEKIRTGLQRAYISALLRWCATCQQYGAEAAAKDAWKKAVEVALAVLRRKISTFDVESAKEEMVRALLTASADVQFLGEDEKASEIALGKVTVWAQKQLSSAMKKLEKSPTEENVREVLKCGATVGLLGGDEKLIEASIQEVLSWAENQLADALGRMKKAPTESNVKEVLLKARAVELLGGHYEQATTAALEASKSQLGATSGKEKTQAAPK